MSGEKTRIFAECIEAVEEGRLTVSECLAGYPQYRAELSELLGIAAEVWAMPVIRPSAEARQLSQARLLAQLPSRKPALPQPFRPIPVARPIPSGIMAAFAPLLFWLQQGHRQLVEKWPALARPGVLAGVAIVGVFSLLLTSGVFAAVGSSIIQNVQGQSEVAQVVSIESAHGVVEILGADGKWTPVSKRIAVTTDYRLRTGDDSRVRIALPDGRVASLGPNSEVSLGELLGNVEAFGGVITGTVTMTPTPTQTPTTPPTATGSQVTICHKPGTPAEKTMTLPVAALSGHMGHGDTLGVCSGPTATMTVTVTLTPTQTPTVTLTPTATPTGTITVTLTPTVIPTMTVTPTDVPGSTDVTICHKPGTPAQQTMTLPISALDAHLGHGDTLGSCSDDTSTSPVPPPAPDPTQPPPSGNGNGGGNGGNGAGNSSGNGGNGNNGGNGSNGNGGGNGNGNTNGGGNGNGG